LVVRKYRDFPHFGQQLLEQLQTLAGQHRLHGGNARDAAVGSGRVHDVPGRHGIEVHGNEDNRRIGTGLPERAQRPFGSGAEKRVALHLCQFGCERRQALELSFGVAEHHLEVISRR
jgi:hypothetical protein